MVASKLRVRGISNQCRDGRTPKRGTSDCGSLSLGGNLGDSSDRLEASRSSRRPSIVVRCSLSTARRSFVLGTIHHLVVGLDNVSVAEAKGADTSISCAARRSIARSCAAPPAGVISTRSATRCAVWPKSPQSLSEAVDRTRRLSVSRTASSLRSPARNYRRAREDRRTRAVRKTDKPVAGTGSTASKNDASIKVHAEFKRGCYATPFGASNTSTEGT